MCKEAPWEPREIVDRSAVVGRLTGLGHKQSQQHKFRQRKGGTRTAAAVGGQKAAFNRLTEHNIQPYCGHTHTLNPIDSLQQSHTRPSIPHSPRG